MVQRCSQCAFDYDAPVTEPSTADIRRGASDIARLLVRSDLAPAIAVRPETDTWSALEYACHVRDVLLVQRDRVILALVEDTPSFAPMHRDERVELAGYDRDPPEEVASQVVMAAELFGGVLDRLSEAHLRRPCLYNFPAQTERDVGWVGRHTAHEVTHHLRDVQVGLERLTPRFER